LQDVAKLLETDYSLNLVASDAVMSFRDGEARLKETGRGIVDVRLRNGDIVPIHIDVLAQEAESAASNVSP
jgi:hypothetical protein